MKARTNTYDCWTIEYSNSDCGATDGHMYRIGHERAEKAARLMRECGYQSVVVRETR